MQTDWARAAFFTLQSGKEPFTARLSEAEKVATSPPLEDPTLVNPRLLKRAQRAKRRMSAGITRAPGVTVVRATRRSERRKALLLTGGKLLSLNSGYHRLGDVTDGAASPTPANSVFFLLFSSQQRWSLPEKDHWKRESSPV